MKISEMITEEMVRAIRNSTPASTNIMIGDDCLILLAINISGGGDSRIAKEYDLARFLFVDAWNYFLMRGWKLTTDPWSVECDKGRAIKRFCYEDYPSKLHAMAAACQYMWEQEGKKQ